MKVYRFYSYMTMAWKPIKADNRAARFAERNILSEIATNMTRLNVQDYIKKYGAPRVVRVLGATIAANPHKYSDYAWRTALKIPPMCDGWEAERFFRHSNIHPAYLQDIFMELARKHGKEIEE